MSSKRPLLQFSIKAITQSCLMVFIIAGLPACSLFPNATVAQLIPLNECKLSNNVNIYIPTVSITTATPTISPFPVTATATATATATMPPPTSLTNKQDAFQNLEYQVKAWTDIATIDMGESNQGQIMLTFLSPDLVKAVSINEALLENPALSDTDKETKARIALEQMASREKLVFLFTMIAINTNGIAGAPHTFSITSDQVFLQSANKLQIEPTYAEQNLNQSIGLSQYNVGYLYYPFAVMNGTICTEVLNPKFNANIILQTSSVVVDNASVSPLTWAIEYKSLLDIGHSAPMFNSQNSYYESDPIPSEVPPMALETSPLFWSDYAKFVWGHLTP